MNNATQYVQQLIRTIIGDRQIYAELSDVLKQQRQMILTHQSSGLIAINARLIDIYRHLADSTRQRNTLLDSLGVDRNLQGIKTLFARLLPDNQQQVNALWRDLEARATKCKTANEENGLLLSMQQEIIQNLLNAGEPQNWIYQQI